MSPVIVAFDGVKLKIHARDHSPPHLHAEGKGGEALIQILDLRVTHVTGFSKNDVRRIIFEVGRRRQLLIEAWETLHGKE
jgi:hypothetical protein